MEQFNVHLDNHQISDQLTAMGIPPAYQAEYAPEITNSLPHTNQPLFKATASGYGEWSPPHTSVSDAGHLVELGLRFGAGGDIYGGSLDHGKDRGVCVTPLNIGKGAAAASLCRYTSVQGGYDNPRGNNGLSAAINIDGARMGDTYKGVKKIGSEAKGAMKALERVYRGRDNTQQGNKNR
jgi:hypothetical protein